MARISYCDMKDGGCNDPNCSVTCCILEVREEQVRRFEEAAEEARIDSEAPATAERILKARGIRHPSWAQVRDLTRNPRLRELVKKQLRDLDDLPPITL